MGSKLINFIDCWTDHCREKIKMATKIKAEFGPILKDHIPSKKEQKQIQKPDGPLALNPYGVPVQSKRDAMNYYCRSFYIFCMPGD